MIKNTTLFLAATLLLGCNETELTPDAPLDYAIVDGDTIKTRNDKALIASQKNKEKLFGRGHTVVGDTVVLYKAPKLHTPPAKAPDLSKLKNNDDPDLKGKPLRMIAIGGSLTAGVRDGGYFNEGIETSYPNLIARQMKLQKFEQPKFDAQDYNGVGRKVRTNQNYTGGPVPKFKAAENNGGVEILDEKQIKLKKYKEKEGLDNFSFPSFHDFYLSPFETLNTEADYNPIAKEFAVRLATSETILSEKVFSKKFDFFLLDYGYQEFFENIINGRKVPQNYDPVDVVLKRSPYTESSMFLKGIIRFAWKLKDNKYNKRGCIFNIPNILEFPYFGMVPTEKVNAEIRKYNTFNVNAFRDGEIFLPTSEIDSLLGTNVHPNLKKGIDEKRPLSSKSYIYSETILNPINERNIILDNIAKYLEIPIVDIKSLYSTIIKGGYITSDGVKVDPSYPNGNFFSSDGINPTAFGQAVIANEVIKTINSFYKTEIPLIPTKEYLEK